MKRIIALGQVLIGCYWIDSWSRYSEKLTVAAKTMPKKSQKRKLRVVEFNEELTGIAGHGGLSVAYVGVEPCRLLSLRQLFGVGHATNTEFRN